MGYETQQYRAQYRDSNFENGLSGKPFSCSSPILPRGLLPDRTCTSQVLSYLYVCFSFYMPRAPFPNKWHLLFGVQGLFGLGLAYQRSRLGLTSDGTDTVDATPDPLAHAAARSSDHSPAPASSSGGTSRGGGAATEGGGETAAAPFFSFPVLRGGSDPSEAWDIRVKPPPGRS